MNNHEAREYVQAGLRQRSMLRKEREDELDAFEEEMISFCNQHSADTKKNQAKTEQRENQRAMKAEKREAMRKKDEAAEKACSKYGYTCVAILLLCAWTPIPFYAAMALIAGLAVFPTVYIVKLYGMV